MSEENQDANTQAEDSSTSTTVSETETNTEAVKTQAEESSAQTGKESEDSLPFHQHPRFKELINEKNELKNQLSQMERILQQKDETKAPSPLEVAKGKLKSLGVKDEAAAELLETMRLVSDSRVQNIEQASVQREIESWVSDFSRNHKDYEELEPQMFEVFQALPQRTQQLIASDPMGIQLIYDHVKMQNVSKELEKAHEDGVKAGYKNKQNKTSVTTTVPGSQNPPGGELTRESIAKMSPAEYKSKQKEIWEAYRAGRIKGE